MILFPVLLTVALAAQTTPSAGPQSRDAKRSRPPGAGQQATKPATRAVDLESLRTQVMLDRAGFSPGAIDGRMGGNSQKALEQFQKQAPAAPEPVEPVVTYAITTADAAGPFVPSMPTDPAQQASLPSLAYSSVLEMLAERFHATPALLQQLNPGAQFAEGEQIQVPNVDPLIVPVEKPQASAEAPAAAKERSTQPAATTGREATPARQPSTIMQRPAVTITVSKATSALTVSDGSGRVIFYAPVTTGSEHDPLPIGEWKVNGTRFNPSFNYNPELFWDADPSHSKARLPPGPNSPVGLVWIDINKDHYGIHGTAEPATIGRAQSHGCVRLSNWDALKLAGMVKPGTRVVFSE